MQNIVKILKALTVSTLFFIISTAAINSYAASFDCTKAGTAIEKQICADQHLSKLDDALGVNYSRMLAANIGDGAEKDLRSKQLDWLKIRNKCQTKNCLVDAYLNRIDGVCEYPVLTGVHPICITSTEFRDRDKTEVSSQQPKISDEEKIDTCIEKKFDQEKKKNLSITRVKIDKWRIECETDIQFSLISAITVESKAPEKETAKIDSAIENKKGFLLGIESYNKGNYQQAFQIFKPLAEQGDARAQAYVGNMYFAGDGTSENDVEALRFARLAAKQGDPNGQSLLGTLYRLGVGVNKNDKEAVRLFELAAQQGNTGGQTSLAEMYEEGRGVPQNLSEAIKLYKLAADKGDAVAKKKVSELTAKSAAIKVDFKVTATAIINEFKSNKLAAGLKYKDKTALIEGVVNEITPTRFIKPESVQIRMRDSNNSLESVRVILSATPEQLSLATSLTKGDYIKASCKNIEGESLSGVLAKNCVLVPHSTGGPVDLIEAAIIAMQFETPNRTSVEAKYIGKRVQANMFITTFAERSGSRRMNDGNSRFFCDVFPAELPKFPTEKGGFVVEGTFVVENGVPGLTRCKYIRDQ